ncbi:hypothetical protein SEQ_HALENA_55 [Mycobacterium phage Halena]|uniref:Uncharacterized protein n=2 Tax=Bronvirus TaxID=1623278 RepID=A0A482JC75_9CAUD|nr:hypothetical protein KNU48_gp103 [Mycobacterium phage Silverleaf]QBP29142.1 hypothetical protein SEA_SILVERLEAF_57 [Mycobacterium phage Silverleaf]QBP29839.1 hypothetical protein SEQ_HALENA_55 [Mycobacterium phage Halena]
MSGYYEVTVSFFNDIVPRKIVTVAKPETDRSNNLVLKHLDGDIVYAAGRWSGYTVKEYRDE